MPKLDTVDWRILNHLQTTPDASISDLAHAVNLSNSPCWRRVQRLRSDGVILGQRLAIDPTAIGLNCTVYAFVKLSLPSTDRMDTFEEQVVTMEEVVSCERVTGAIDYLLKIVTTDVQGYDRFLREQLLKMQLVSDVESHIVVARTPVSANLPLRTAEAALL
ncbi:MAG: Lrp/AsnC family transcriptional regulator [Pseudomonadota bacterium]